jgi:hypothetical protein
MTPSLTRAARRSVALNVVRPAGRTHLEGVRMAKILKLIFDSDNLQL